MHTFLVDNLSHNADDAVNRQFLNSQGVTSGEMPEV
jgi:hypothetical protein